jgi:uncharacterized protein YbjT (DUF2867 family)
MKILVTGAYGFIGSAVTARIEADGHQIVGVGRNIAKASRQQPGVRWVALDISKAKRAEDWLPHLAGVDGVVNCAGALQDGGSDDIHGLHVDGTVALFAACEQAGVKRVVHFSAIGIDRETPTKFSQTKLIADNDLKTRNLDWIILRPSVVYGRNAYGGSALLRAAASLPDVIPAFPDTADLQVVHLDDVTETVAFLIKDNAPARIALELAGPERLPFTQILKTYRRWLGFRDAKEVTIPRWLAALAFKTGDAISWLGWRPPVRTTAQRELSRGAIGDPGEWKRVTGIAPRSLRQALAREPASIQEKWFARLFLLKPLMLGVLVMFWIGTGLLALGPGHALAVGLMKEGGASEEVAKLTVFAASIMDIAVGAAMAIKSTAYYALLASIFISLFYVVIGSAILPRLWADPLGPMTKMWPVIVFTIATIAILDDR